MIGPRGWYILCAATVSSLVAFKFPSALMSSTTALEAIIAVFSILAGVLVAVISIVGDPSMLLQGNWRLAFEDAKDVQKKISNYANLIAIYIVDLLLVIVAIVLNDMKVGGFTWFYGAVTWLSVFGFLLSIPLPYSLMAIQSERMDAEIERRKKGMTRG